MMTELLTAFKNILILFAFSLSACTNPKVLQSAPDTFVMAENSLCASPSIIAVDLIDNTAATVLIGGKEVSLKKNLNLIREVFVPDYGAFNITFPKPSSQCYDKSVYKFSLKNSENEEALKESPTFFHVKFIELKSVDANSDYICSPQKVLKGKNNQDVGGDINFKLCEFTKQKILSDGAWVTPLNLCRIIEIFDCTSRILSERRRIVDLQKLNLLREIDGFDATALLNKMEIHTIDIEADKISDIYKILYKDALNEKKRNSNFDTKNHKYINYNPLTDKQLAASSLEEILLVSLEAQQAVFEAID